MMTEEVIQHNANQFKNKCVILLISVKESLIVNNADWLLELKYIDFTRSRIFGQSHAYHRILKSRGKGVLPGVQLYADAEL